MPTQRFKRLGGVAVNGRNIDRQWVSCAIGGVVIGLPEVALDISGSATSCRRSVGPGGLAITKTGSMNPMGSAAWKPC